MLKRKLFIIILMTACFKAGLIAAQEDFIDVAIFPVYTGDMQHDEILKACEFMTEEAFSASKRFYPLPHRKVEDLLGRSDGKDRGELYRKTAIAAGAELFCVIDLSVEKGLLSLSINIEPLDELYSGSGFEKKIYARIPANIAAKCAREIALHISKTKLKCRVTDKTDGVIRLNAGQWHGLSAGRYRTSAGYADITSADRFTSSAVESVLSPGDVIEFEIYPDTVMFIKKINREIDENSARFYGTDTSLNKRRGSAKESIIGTCVINQGASFCLPGYGSFLSVEYMGIEKGEPDMYGVFAIGTLTALHLTLPSMMNSFDVNFLPWIMDDDKEKQDQRLQYYLWGTLPLTFSVSFYNQLAYQYHRKSLLPPLFEDHDTTAAAVSVFIPGGGMFYKGRRLEGWCFYLSEISLGAYAVYEWDKTSGKAAAGGLLLLKAAEIALSYAVSPSYKVYRTETGSADSFPAFSVGFNPGIGGTEEIILSAVIPF
jgi:hypothetical protein